MTWSNNSETTHEWQHREFPLPGGGFAHVASRDGIGDPIVLLHGQLSDWAAWQPLIATLDPEIAARPLYAIDLRGHGKSWQPRSGYRPRDFADDVVAVFDFLQLDNATVVGDRLGSLVAMELVRHRPAETNQLVLIEPPLPGPAQQVETDDYWETAIDLFVWFAELRRQPVHVIEEHLSRMFPNERAGQIAARAVALRSVSSDYLEAVMNGEADWTDAMMPFEPDARPVLVIGGDDRSTTGLAAAGESLLQDVWPEAEVKHLPGGHELLAESPALVADAVNAWLPQTTIR